MVTGGTSGIGLAIAGALEQRGVNVMIADIREDAIPATVDALAGRPGHAAGVRADVSVDADLDALADATVERWYLTDVAGDVIPERTGKDQALKCPITR